MIMPMPDQQNLLQLHDIHLPAAASWWPPAPGWWILSAVILLLLTWIVYRLGKWIKAALWRKKLLSEFNQYHARIDAMDDTRLATEISRHLRQLALTLYPASEVASLTGTDWLEFLESHSRQKGFHEEPGCYLVEAPYKPTENRLSTAQKKQLLKLARQWAIYNTALYSANQKNRQPGEQ